jgi:hypothetical protein
LPRFKVSENSFKKIDTICLFRDEIHPSWEDDNNKDGGQYYFMVFDCEPSLIDKLWINLISGLVGESFPGVEIVKEQAYI